MRRGSNQLLLSVSMHGRFVFERVQADGGGVGGSNERNFQGEVSLVCERVYGVVELDRKHFFLFFFTSEKIDSKDDFETGIKII